MAHDAARGVTVLFGGYDDGYPQDTWEWDGETWTERTPDGPLPIARYSHAMAYDTARGVTVLFGGYRGGEYLQDNWEWHHPLMGRPAHRWTVSWPHAFASDDAVSTSAEVVWVGSGLGHETDGICAPIHGAELKAWTGLGWQVIDSTGTDPTAPEALTWQTTDPDELRRLFFGKTGEETLSFAVTPTAPNGCGSEYGQITTNYVEVTVSYRLLAE